MFTQELTEHLVALELLETRSSDDSSDVGLRLTHHGVVRTVLWQDKGQELLDQALDTLSAQERAAIALALPALEHLPVALSNS